MHLLFVVLAISFVIMLFVTEKIILVICQTSLKNNNFFLEKFKRIKRWTPKYNRLPFYIKKH